jgi:membrane-associated protease RseP (regulator of RpoE activity)
MASRWKFSRAWVGCITIAIFLGTASAQSTANRAVSTQLSAGECEDSARFRRDVDAAWIAVRDRYVYLSDRAVDWPLAHVLYGQMADTVHAKRELVGVLEQLLATLYDPHATLHANTGESPRLVPSGLDFWAEWRGAEAVITAVRPGYSAEQAGVRPGMRLLAINGVSIDSAAEARLGIAVLRPATVAARQWALLSASAGRHSTPRTLRVRDLSGQVRELALDQPGHHVVDTPNSDQPVEFRRLSGVEVRAARGSETTYGYIQLNALGDSRSVPAFDSALAALRTTRGVVLDLRNTPGGGNTDVAEPILGRLITTAAGYQRVVPREGPAYVRMVQTRGPWAYTAPVVVLVGRWTGSMGEAMAMGLDAMHRAKVVGTRMAGLAGAVDDVTLPCSGISLGLPTARLLHLNGTPRERWVPPMLVDFEAAKARARFRAVDKKLTGLPDLVLERGLAILRAHLSP